MKEAAEKYSVKRNSRWLQGTDGNKTVWRRERKELSKDEVIDCLKVLLEEYKTGSIIPMEFKVFPIEEVENEREIY